MKVVYYTFTPFLDCAIELINVLKKHVELHVIIEISHENKTSNIIDVQELPEVAGFVSPDMLLSEQSYNLLEPYLEGTASANFFVYTQKRSFSLATLKESFKVGRYIRGIKPDVIHFEGFSQRSLGAIPFMRAVKKVFYTVHDPQPHSGEANWRLSLAKFFHFRLAKGYFFYSKFARKQFAQHYKREKAPKYVLSLFPYSFYRRNGLDKSHAREYLLFFGRVSPYKGVDVLMKAMPLFLEKNPQEKLIIAGKAVNGFAVDKEVLADYSESIKVIDRYLTNEELAGLISNSKAVICPYKDATQSGVLMTAFAFHTPVVASNVGAFPEYIEDNVNGLLFPVNHHIALAEQLQKITEADTYRKYEGNLLGRERGMGWETNVAEILQLYAGTTTVNSSKKQVAS